MGNYFDDLKPLAGSLRCDCVYIAPRRLDYLRFFLRGCLFLRYNPLANGHNFSMLPGTYIRIWIRDILTSLFVYEIIFKICAQNTKFIFVIIILSIKCTLCMLLYFFRVPQYNQRELVKGGQNI